MFSLMTEISCLFSSQVPLPLFLEDSLKFVEVHQAFFKHDWLHERKLKDSNRSTTWPLSRLFSRVMKFADRDSSAPAKETEHIIP